MTSEHPVTVSIIDLHRIAGEYLTDPQWTVIGYMVREASIDLTVGKDDVASIRHAYEQAVAIDEYCDVVNLATGDGQQQMVSVYFRCPDRLMVWVHTTFTEPAVVARLRAVATEQARDGRVIAALTGPSTP